MHSLKWHKEGSNYPLNILPKYNFRKKKKKVSPVLSKGLVNFKNLFSASSSISLKPQFFVMELNGMKEIEMMPQRKLTRKNAMKLISSGCHVSAGVI